MQRRRVLYLSCEDREDILHWRLSRICAHLGVKIVDLKDWLELIDLVGCDTLLWDRDPSTGNTITPAYGELDQRFRDTGRQIVFVDGIADVYGGGESTRGEVKRFVNSLIKLIDPHAGAVVLIGHVAKPTANGIATSEGYSGTTGWHNSVRARWYLRPETVSEDGSAAERTGKLVLELQKSNHGSVDKQILFAWDDAARIFVGQTVASAMHLDKKLRDKTERDGILSAIGASIQAGVLVPAAVSGKRTSYHVLSVRPEFPATLKGDKMDGVKQDVRSNDNHLGRSAGYDCRWLAV